MQTKAVVSSRKKALQDKLYELLQPSPEREEIKVETFADPLDQLSSATTRELAIHLVDRNSRLVAQVRSAIARIDEGSYGLCESCEGSIAPKRLDAVPWAPLCVCQARQEATQVDSGHFADAACMVNRVQVSRMPSGIVALVGDLHIDRQALDLMAAEFHWSLKQFRTIHELAQANVDNNLIAVLFDPKSLSLPRERALRVILEAAPGALPILCHRFAEVVDWPQLAEAGAFHSLRFPLDLREARQTLGFVWEARRHSAAFSMQVRHNPKQAVSEQTQESGARAPGMVA